MGIAAASPVLAEWADSARPLPPRPAGREADTIVPVALTPPVLVDALAGGVSGTAANAAQVARPDFSHAGCPRSSGSTIGTLADAPGHHRDSAARVCSWDRHRGLKWVTAAARDERGIARGYLEQTAAARWLRPGLRVVQTWEATSGYGAVEAGRAAGRPTVLATTAAPNGARSAGDPEPPSGSAIGS
jgi:hypothetical protein